ncbi:MAG: DNA/RNA nuclease SfsA [Aestuariibacter sp.]
MQFASTLIKGTLVRRYKRFLADVVLPDGTEVVAHCPNTGAMTGCAEPGFDVWLRHANDPKRKLQYTWELAANEQGQMIGINTANANKLVAEALQNKVITELAHYSTFRREVAFGNEKSKVDFVLSGTGIPSLYLEVKSVTLLENQHGYFPDTQTSRGQKHLRELTAVQNDSDSEAALLFCVQHTGIKSVTAARHLDPEYARLLLEAVSAGVKVYAYSCEISPDEILLTQRLPYQLA